MRRTAWISLIVIAAFLVAIVGVRNAPGGFALASDSVGQPSATTSSDTGNAAALGLDEDHAHHGAHAPPAARTIDGETVIDGVVGTHDDCGDDRHHMEDTCCSFACHAVIDMAVYDSALVPATRATGDGSGSHAVVLGHPSGLDRPPRSA